MMNAWQKIVSGFKMTFKFYCQHPFHGAIELSLFGLFISAFVLYPAGAFLLAAVLTLIQLHKYSAKNISQEFVEKNMDWIEKQFPNL